MTATELERPALEDLLKLGPDDLLKHAEETRSELLTRGDSLRELRQRAPERRSDNWSAELKAETFQITSLDAELTALLSAYRYGSEVRAAEQAAQGQGPVAALGQVPGKSEVRSLGQQFVEHPNYANRNKPHPDPIEVRGLLSTEKSDPAGGLWMPVGQPIPPRPRQMRFFLRDLVPSSPTNLNSVPYLMEVNPVTYEMGASAVAEGEAKPEVDMKTSLVDAPVRKVAGWIPVTSEIIEDAPTLRGYIDARLMYMVAVREQDMLLNGSGTTPFLRGIRQFSGIQTQNAVSGDVPATIGLAIAKVENVDLMATGIVMHPTDFWTTATTRHATQFDEAIASSTGAPIDMPSQTIWGMRVVRTRAMTVGKALVGDFTQAHIWDRRSATLSVTDSHSDYFIKNKLVILAEERLALSVHRPDAFVEASL